MASNLSPALIFAGLLCMIGSIGAFEYNTISFTQFIIQVVVSTGLMIAGKAML